MRNERGFVSLFTTIMLSLLLLVITISLVSLEAIQLRKSEDSEQTLRAYYAAEAGIEDGAAKVLSGAVTTDQTCVAQPNYDPTGAAGWTCQQISFSGSPTGILKDANVAKTIDPGSFPYTSVVIEWNQSNNASVPFFRVPPGGLPSQAAYNFAPTLEVAIVQYPKVAFAANNPNLKLTNALIVPRGPVGGAVNYAVTGVGQQFNGNCAPGNSRVIAAGLTSHYNCWAQIQNLNGAGFNYLFRLRSRYGPTSYKVSFISAAGAVITVPDGTATIDVTAKAGQTFRRVISKLPINAGAAGGLNYVMYSDTNVCKGFDVMNNLPVVGTCPY